MKLPKHRRDEAALNSRLIRRPIKRMVWLFLLPTFAAFCIGFLYPFFKGLFLSFCNFRITSQWTWTGLENYRKAFQDPGYMHAFWYTALFALVSLIAINLFANYGVETVDLSKVGPVSRLIERTTGFPIAFNKPLVGRNAFAHESGIHVHGVMSNAFTYEPLKPELVGVDRHIVIGKHSGEHSVRGRLDALCISFPEERMPELMEAIKEAAVGEKEIDDAELMALVDHILRNVREGEAAVKLDGIAVLTGKGVTSTATVNLTVNGEKRVMAETGVGPVDAAIKAIAGAVGDSYTLAEYKLAAINGSSSSLCEATVMVRNNKRAENALSTGRSVGPDVVQTSIDAMISAINRDKARE